MPATLDVRELPRRVTVVVHGLGRAGADDPICAAHDQPDRNLHGGHGGRGRGIGLRSSHVHHCVHARIPRGRQNAGASTHRMTCHTEMRHIHLAKQPRRRIGVGGLHVGQSVAQVIGVVAMIREQLHARLGGDYEVAPSGQVFQRALVV